MPYPDSIDSSKSDHRNPYYSTNTCSFCNEPRDECMCTPFTCKSDICEGNETPFFRDYKTGEYYCTACIQQLGVEHKHCNTCDEDTDQLNDVCYECDSGESTSEKQN